MQSGAFLSITFGLVFLTVGPDQWDRGDRSNPGLAGAIRQTAAWRSYSFQIDERPGQGTRGAFEGQYEKGQPIPFKAAGIEFSRQGEALVYREGERCSAARPAESPIHCACWVPSPRC